MHSKVEKSREPKQGVLSRILKVTSFPQEMDGKLAQSVSRYLSDRSPRVRAAALGMVGKAQLHEAEEQVLRLLSDKCDAVRYSAVECLGLLHEGEQVPVKWLYPLMSDPDALVRIETLESLVQIGDKEALPLILKMLEDSSALVRSYAAWSFAQMDGRKYLPAIQRAYETETDEIAKVGFVDALFALGDQSQFSPLLEFLSSSDYQVRCASANALNAAELTAEQLQSAITAVSYASKHALFRGDRTTMEEVEKDLRERV